MYQFRNLPVGWCFTPDDEKLIKVHLLPKVRGFPLLWDGIVEKDLYGVDAPPPWEMFSDIDGDDSVSPSSLYIHTETNKERTATRKTLYVYTKLKAKAAASTSEKPRVARRAGGGTWSCKSKPKTIVDSATGNIIGHTKQLAFKHEGVDEQVVGHWIMHEYSLHDGWGSDFVLCKIIRCTTHPAPPLPVEEEEEEELEEELENEHVSMLEPDSKKHKTELIDTKMNWMLVDDKSENMLDYSYIDRYADEQEKTLEVEEEEAFAYQLQTMLEIVEEENGVGNQKVEKTVEHNSDETLPAASGYGTLKEDIDMVLKLLDSSNDIKISLDDFFF